MTHEAQLIKTYHFWSAMYLLSLGTLLLFLAGFWVWKGIGWLHTGSAPELPTLGEWCQQYNWTTPSTDWVAARKVIAFCLDQSIFWPITLVLIFLVWRISATEKHYKALVEHARQLREEAARIHADEGDRSP
jgi:hypothetical protein